MANEEWGSRSETIIQPPEAFLGTKRKRRGKPQGTGVRG